MRRANKIRLLNSSNATCGLRRAGGALGHFRPMYQTCINKGVALAWKPMGRPTVREQRNKWIVRIDGVDTETGKIR